MDSTPQGDLGSSVSQGDDAWESHTSTGPWPRCSCRGESPLLLFKHVWLRWAFLPQGCKVSVKSHLCYSSVSVSVPCKWFGIDVALGLACALDNIWWIAGKSILFPTLQKHILDWQYSSSDPKRVAQEQHTCSLFLVQCWLLRRKLSWRQACSPSPACHREGQQWRGADRMQMLA